MAHFIDRRLNPKGKSLSNRRRFIERARKQIKDSIQKSIKDRSVGDLGKGGAVSIPSSSTAEPRFRADSRKGDRRHVHPGNKEFVTGDQIRKPRGGSGGGGKQASDSGDGEDSFQFTLTADEFLDIFFEDLELPNLVKTSLKEMKATAFKRAGITTAGSPTNLNLVRTMRNSLGRRLALRRPSANEINRIKGEIFRLERIAEPTPEQIDELRSLHEELESLEKRRKWTPYIDPIDLRFNTFEETPVETSAAVMFCLMDVSGSMGEREKDLAKRFYMLLHLFLRRRYEKVDVVFVRHTHHAEEVDEETFFYSRQSGGTIVSTALEEMLKIQAERYPPDQWNIYVAQASDGYTQSGDANRCVELLTSEILPISQYYAYIEIIDEREIEIGSAELWRAYQGVEAAHANFATTRISHPSDIFPVFRELFSPSREAAA